MFDSIATLAVAANMRELYRLVLVDTPLAPYFAETLSSEDLDEMNIEILRNTLYKVRRLGGESSKRSHSALRSWWVLVAREFDQFLTIITWRCFGACCTRHANVATMAA